MNCRICGGQMLRLYPEEPSRWSCDDCWYEVHVKNGERRSLPKGPFYTLPRPRSVKRGRKRESET